MSSYLFYSNDLDAEYDAITLSSPDDVDNETSFHYDDDDLETLVDTDNIRTDVPSSTAFVLTFEKDDPRETRLYTASNERTVYKVHSQAHGGSKSQGSRELMTVLTKSPGTIVGTYLRPAKRGSETVIFADKKPKRRSTWFTTGRPFSNTVGKFHHESETYKWICRKVWTGVCLELHSSSEQAPIARFIDSRRDWTAPPATVVIKKARLELEPAAVEIIDQCVFSLLITEMLRRERVHLSVV